MAQIDRRLRLVHPAEEAESSAEAELERLIAEIVPPEPPAVSAETPSAPSGRNEGPAYDTGIGPLPRNRFSVGVVVALVAACAVAIAIACWWLLRDTPGLRDVSRHIDEETAVLPRESPDADEHRKALLRSVRPDLLRPDAGRTPAPAPSQGSDRGNAASDLPDQVVPKTVPSPLDAPRTPLGPEGAGPAEGARPDAGPAGKPASGPAAGPGEAAPTARPTPLPKLELKLPKGQEVIPPKPENKPDGTKSGASEERSERPAVRALRQAGIRHNVRRARASMDRGTAPGPLGPLTLPNALRPTQPPG